MDYKVLGILQARILEWVAFSFSIGETDAEAKAPIYFDHLMGRTDSLEKTLMLGMIEGKRRG